MKLASLFSLLLSAIFLVVSVPAQARQDQAGEEFRITLFHSSESQGDKGFSSSSSGGHVYGEKILAVEPGGVERLYDIPADKDDESRKANWQFPVRIFESNGGKFEILNRAEMERRRDKWLEAAKIPSESCGKWYFTWNAFQIACDPDTVIQTIRTISIRPAILTEGEEIEDPAALTPGKLIKVKGVGGKSSFRAQLPVNPDYFYQTEAKADVIIGELTRTPVSFETAYEKRKTEEISGTVEILLETNEDSRPWKKVRIIRTRKTDARGEVILTVSKETIERTSLLAPI